MKQRWFRAAVISLVLLLAASGTAVAQAVYGIDYGREDDVWRDAGHQRARL